jgi:tetratricopeptide (TPR) repeat protein
MTTQRHREVTGRCALNYSRHCGVKRCTMTNRTASGSAALLATRSISVAAALLVASQRLHAQQSAAADIVARHLEARGGAERLRSMETVVYSGGLYREGSYVGSGRAFMAMARPYFKIVGDPADSSSDFREGYDGSSWEWYRSPGIVVRTVGAANAAMRHNLDPDGPFSDYREKGSRVDRVADATIAGRKTFGILLTLRDGSRALYLIDQQTYLISAVRKVAPIHAFGAQVATEERVSDYRAVDGILFAFASTEVDIATGKELNSMTWHSIEVNRKLPPEWFSPPSFIHTRLQEFLEQLYYERSDSTAIRWSYVAFRRGHPDTDTRAGVEMVGYQMLKMGDHDGATALLTMNASDYPRSSSSAFGLGRALAAAGNETRAIQEFERALKLDPANKAAAAALASIGHR